MALVANLLLSDLRRFPLRFPVAVVLVAAAAAAAAAAGAAPAATDGADLDARMRCPDVWPMLDEDPDRATRFWFVRVARTSAKRVASAVAVKASWPGTPRSLH